MPRKLTLPLSAVAAFALVQAVPASAAPDALSADAPLTANSIARGVLASNGNALTSADVVAVAWPNQSTMLTLKEGDAVPTFVLGRSKTNTAGSFAIDVAPSAIPAMYRGEAGSVDVEMVFGDARREGRWNYTATPSPSSGWVVRGSGDKRPDFRADLGRSFAYDRASDPASWLDARGVALGTPGRAASALGVSAATADFAQLRSEPLATLRTSRQMRGTKDQVLARAASAKGSTPFAAGPYAVGCVAYVGTTHYGLSEYFMKAYAWSGAYAEVHQDYGNDHTLGIGLSTSAAGTSFTQSGTQSVNMAASAVRGGVADATVYNKMNYRDYKNTCNPKFQRKPLSVNALLTAFNYAPHVYWGTCTTYTGGTFRKATGVNSTYSSGMNIGPANVSARSGWDANTEIVWTLSKKTKLCGSTTAGWASAPQAETHAG